MSASTTSVAPDRRTGRRRGRFAPAPTVLVTATIGWAAVVASTVIVLALSGVSLLSEATSAQYASLTGLLALRGTVWLIACCWGAVGVGLVARRLLAVGGPARAFATGALVAVGLALAGAVGQLVIPWTAVGFREPTLGDTAAYGQYYVASCLSIWSAVAAVVLVALALRTTGVRRTAMAVLAGICVVYLVVDIVTRGGIPPFAVAFVWLALGVLLRSSRVPA